MARKSLSAVRGGSTALATIDQELSNEVALLKQQIGQPGGRAIKVNPTGSFTSPEGMDLGNEIQVVVVDFISKNFFYDGPYVPQTPSAPACYAANKVIADMAPDPDCPSPQAETCAKCPLNQFGSGNNGKSKACKNTRELAVLLVDQNNPDALGDPSTPLYTLSLPPTALRSFDGAAAVVARTLGGPPLKAILTVTATNAGTYALIAFSDPVANPHYADHAQRRAEAAELLARKPDFSNYAAPAPVRRPPARQPARAAAGGRR